MAGDPLAEVQHQAEEGLAFTRKTRFGLIADILASRLGLIRTLRGLTPEFGSFDDDQFDEAEFERHLSRESAIAECFYRVLVLQARSTRR